MRFISLVLVLSFCSVGFSQIPNYPPNRLRIMSWNVENLYDPEHEEGTNDYEYMPINHPLKKQGCIEHIHPNYRERCLQTDWTRPKLLIKYGQIKKMVQSVGTMPDVLALLEVENERVVSELAKVLGYKKWAITKTDDERGVDQAILFNEKPGFQFVGQRDVQIPLNSLTRPILHAAFQYNGQRLNVYVNHWPATAAPTAQRIIAAQTLRKAIDEDNNGGQKKNVYTVALGDFNVTPENKPYPFDVLHDKNWNNHLYDLDSLSRHYVHVPGLGTYFFGLNMRWSLLDRIFLSRNFLEQKALKLPVNRYQIVRTYSRDWTSKPNPTTGQVMVMKQVPIRYDTRATTPDSAGFSDHFPVMFEIVAGSAQ